MITIPVYELLLLPGVTFFFKKDMFPKGRITEENIGEEILFVLQKKEMVPEEISMENIFPVGVLGTIESIDEEGSIKVTTKCRWRGAGGSSGSAGHSGYFSRRGEGEIRCHQERTDGFCQRFSVGRLGAQHDLSLEELSGSNLRFGWLYEPFLGGNVDYC